MWTLTRHRQDEESVRKEGPVIPGRSHWDPCSVTLDMKEGPCWVSLEKARLPGRPFWGCNGYISKTKSSLSQTNWTVNPVFLDCLRTYFEKCDLGSWWHSFWWLVVLDTNSYIIWGWQPMLFLLRKPNAFPPPPLFWNELVLFFFFLSLLYYLFFFFWLYSVQDLSSLTRDWSHSPCIGNMVS